MKNVLLTLYSRKIGNHDQIWTGKWGAQSGNFSSGCGTSREMMWWCNCASWMTQWPVRRCITGFGGKGARGLLQTAAPVFGNDAMTVKRLNVEKMTSSRLLPNLRGLWIDVRNEWIKMSHRSKIKMIHLKKFHSTNKSPGAYQFYKIPMRSIGRLRAKLALILFRTLVSVRDDCIFFQFRVCFYFLRIGFGDIHFFKRKSRVLCYVKKLYIVETEGNCHKNQAFENFGTLL